jgi:hypothetical protein
MGFGRSMVASIKNNKRNRPSAFSKLKKHQNGAYKEGTIDKKASPELLKEIREKTIRKNRIRFIKKAIILSITVLIFFLIVWLS